MLNKELEIFKAVDSKIDQESESKNERYTMRLIQHNRLQEYILLLKEYHGQQRCILDELSLAPD